MQDVQFISGDTTSNWGMYGNFMEDVGFWDGNYIAVPDVTVQNMATSSGMMSAITSLGSSSTQSQFQYALSNITGASYNRYSCQKTGDCYAFVQLEPKAAVIATYQSLYNTFTNDLNLAITNNQNISAMFEPYNNSFVSIYLQSVFALQQAYTMEYIINQMNYEYTINNLSSNDIMLQIPSLGGVPGTYFSYNGAVATIGSEVSTQSQLVNVYNEAQHQLTQMYAARFNLLFQNTISYMISDKPIGNQSYPTEPVTMTINNDQVVVINASDYHNMSSNAITPINYIQSKSGTFDTPSNHLGDSNSIAMSANNTMLYQYGGLNNINQCISSIDQYINSNSTNLSLSAALNAGNCGSLFADNSGSGGAYNKSTYQASGNFIPYLALSNNQAPVLAHNTWGGFDACNHQFSNMGLGQYNGNNYVYCDAPLALNWMGVNSSTLWVDIGGTNYASTITMSTNNNPIGWRDYGSATTTVEYVGPFSADNYSWNGEIDTSSTSTQYFVNTSTGVCNSNMQLCGTLTNNFAAMTPDGFWIPFQFIFDANSWRSSHKSDWTTNITLNYNSGSPVANGGAWQCKNTSIGDGNGSQSYNRISVTCNTAYGNTFVFSCGAPTKTQALSCTFSDDGMENPYQSFNTAGFGLNSNEQVQYTIDGISYKTLLQGDGNLVSYKNNGSGDQVIWASGFCNNNQKVTRVQFQIDGNLVALNSANQPVWSSNTNGWAQRLMISTKGNMYLVNSNGDIIKNAMLGDVSSSNPEKLFNCH